MEILEINTKHSDSEMFSKLNGERSKTNTKFLCKPCKSKFSGQVKCIVCDKMKLKHLTLLFYKEKYSNDEIVATINAENGCDRICKTCDRRLQAINACTCCHQKFIIYRVIKYDATNYNFEDYIVS